MEPFANSLVLALAVFGKKVAQVPESIVFFRIERRLSGNSSFIINKLKGILSGN
mgnify:FL=1